MLTCKFTEFGLCQSFIHTVIFYYETDILNYLFLIFWYLLFVHKHGFP